MKTIKPSTRLEIIIKNKFENLYLSGQMYVGTKQKIKYENGQEQKSLISPNVLDFSNN